MLWAFSLQMLFLHSSDPLRRIYLSDFSCMRVLERSLSLLFLRDPHLEKFTVRLFLGLVLAV